ncbi:MAG TPA: hypothetical protein ENJ02_00340 [Chloroflexi bacterium]|nr:hypothetical protein [Chloroflexota bacterium]
MNAIDPRAPSRTRARYQRVSYVYDLMELLPERKYLPWRKRLWEQVSGPRVLEVGVGTGKKGMGDIFKLMVAQPSKG